MSGGIAPSKSTVYVSNFAFSLTNNDLHKIFEKYGKVVKVTIVKDRVTRRSKGVAFVLFLHRESAYQAVRALNKTELFGRTIKCMLAKDNGRATEFIRKKNYPDKSKCYECGEEGHLSYRCPKNLLGEREPPPKKKKERKREREEKGEYFNSSESDPEGQEQGEDPKSDSLATAVQLEQQKIAKEETSSHDNAAMATYLLDQCSEPKRKKYKKDTYFSDEEEIDNDHDDQ